jgi:hypothetical protein
MVQIDQPSPPTNHQDVKILLWRARIVLQSLDHPNRVQQLAASSLALYRHEYARLVHATELNLSINEALTSGGTRSTYHLRRNALRHFESLSLKEALADLDSWSILDVGAPHVQALLKRIAHSVDWLTLCEQQPIGLTRRAPHSRRRRFRLLPKDWQEALLQRASPALRPALRIMSLTGCRPVELSLGVKVRIPSSSDPLALVLQIKNAKNGVAQRPDHRTYYFKRGAENLDTLVEELAHLPPSPKLDLFDSDDGIFYARNVKPRVYQISRLIWPDREHRPSAYSYRYAFREKLKGLGCTAEEIAEAMGHSNTRTQSTYGRGYSRGPAQERSFSFAGSMPVRRNLERERKLELFLERVRDRERVLEHELERQIDSEFDTETDHD